MKQHKLSKTPIYNSWSTMIQRCTNPNATDYHLYGGRGIEVCEEWRVFTNFYRDMGERPEGTTLDRFDTNLGYFKDNCRWADKITQENNKNNNVRVVIDGEALTVKQAAERTGLLPTLIYAKIRKGLPLTKLPTGRRKKVKALN